MERMLTRSNLHFELALERLPLRVGSDCDDPGENRTFYVKYASGARLWDIDDNCYIDYGLGNGQAILGYADPRIAQAASAGVAVGGAFAFATELEFAVAERIARMAPAAELVYFSSSGAEATLTALRLARSFTGKHAIAVATSGAQGPLSVVLRDTGSQRGSILADPAPCGSVVCGPLDSCIHYVPDQDANRLAALLQSHGGEIGALLIEPRLGNRASKAAEAVYLGDVRAICDRFEVVLILDEETTGFRVARGGAQDLLGVRADLCIFGPSMASGFPIAALAGRKEIMRRIGAEGAPRGSRGPHPVSLWAADKTLEILDETDALEQIARYGWRMREGMRQILSRRGVPHAFSGPPSMSRLRIGESATASDPGCEERDGPFCHHLALHLRETGILCEADLDGPWFVSAAHNELCLAETLAKFEHATEAGLERLPRLRRRIATPGSPPLRAQDQSRYLSR